MISKQKLRWLLRDIAYLPLMLPGAASAAKKLGRQAAIISFHNVLPAAFNQNSFIHNVDLATETFERQILFLLENYDVKSADQIFDWPHDEGVFLSFDDGMLNNWDIIVPVLKKFDLTAIFAVCPSIVNRQNRFFWKDWLYLGVHDAYERDELGSWSIEKAKSSPESLFREICDGLYHDPDVYQTVKQWFPDSAKLEQSRHFDPQRFSAMAWEQIGEIQSQGHQIASHTMTHRPLAILPDQEIKTELNSSKDEIESRLGSPCDLLVYPYGTKTHVDQRAMTIAKECGYKMAFMNIPDATADKFSVPRFGLPSTTNQRRLLGSVCGFHDWIKH
jgi:peptidoglycan/xylan/chitin deacetylase (PgdA/CDA1 family)